MRFKEKINPSKILSALFFLFGVLVVMLPGKVYAADCQISVTVDNDAGTVSISGMVTETDWTLYGDWVTTSATIYNGAGGNFYNGGSVSATAARGWSMPNGTYTASMIGSSDSGFNGSSSCGDSEEYTINKVSSIAIDGVCGGSYQQCAAGDLGPSDIVGYEWRWWCMGINSGDNTFCSKWQNVNGECASTHYGCSVGTSVNNGNNTSSYDWVCNGYGTGGNEICSEPKNGTINLSSNLSTSWWVDASVDANDYFDTGTSDSRTKPAGNYRAGGSAISGYSGPTVSPSSDYVTLSANGSINFTLTYTALVMSGTLTSSASSCTIALNASSCNVNLNWGITNPETTPTAITASGMTNINVTNTLTTPQSGTASNVVVPYSSRTFYLYNNSKSLVPASPSGAGITVTSSCTAGTNWNGSICANIPPVANAGPDKAITLPTSTSAPTGTSATDTAPGTISSTVWTKVSGPSATITNGSTLTPSFSAMTTAGTYVFRLTATDNNGATHTDDMQVVVSSALVMSGTLTPASSTCTIALGASSCTSGTLTWTTTNPVATSAVTNNGTATPASPSGNNSSSTFTVPYLTAQSGITSFYLYNNSVQLATATVTTICTAGTNWNGSICANIPPVANAGPDKAITLPTSASAPTGTSATDTSPGTVSSTVWTKVSGPSATITSGSTLTPSFSAMTTAGTYVFRLTATDNNGATHTDDMQVVVSSALLMSGTLTPASSTCTIALGASSCTSGTLTWTTTNPQATSAVTNNGTATPASPSGNNSSSTFTVPYYTAMSGVTSFYLYNNSVPLATATVTTICTAGTNWNGSICANIPPVANAGPDKAITLPTSASAPTGTSATDTSPGTVSSTVWTKVSGPSATITSGSTLTPSFSAMTTAGTYVFRLTATDNNGATHTDDMQVVVSSALLMSGTLTPASSTCTIALGASSCTSGTLTWTTTNPQATSAVTNNGTATPASPSGNNSSSTFTVPYYTAMSGVTSFYLYNNSVPLATATVTTICTAGTNWNGSICANIPPVANAGPDKAITLPTSASAPTGTSATDTSPGTVSSTVWTKVSGPSATITSGSTLTPSFSAMTTAGTYVFRLTATDNNGATHTDDMQVVVSSALLMSGTLTPASSTCTIALGASSCTSGTLTWTTTNPQATSAVTNNGTATPASPSGNNSSSTFTVPYYTAMSGVTSFYLYNNSVPLATATVTTICTAGTNWNGSICANIPPVANAGPDKAITLPTSASAPTGTSATDTSPGTVSSTVWTKVSGPSATITSGSTLTPSFSAMTTAGTYVFRLTATDNNGATHTDHMQVVVSSALLMSGTLTPASSTCTIALGASSCTSGTLTWTTTNPQATSAVTNNGTATPASPSGNNSSSTFTVPYYTAMSGVTSFYLYNNSVPLATATVTTICTAGTNWNGSICANIPPVANAGPDKAITLPTSASAPTGTSATDTSPGTVSSTVWTKVSGPSATITSGSTLTPSFSAMTTAGTYVFRLTATDNNGATHTDDMQVVVSSASATSGTLSATDCTIPSGENNCSSILTWNVNNPVGNSILTFTPGGVNPASPFTASSSDSGSRLFTIPYNAGPYNAGWVTVTLTNNGFSISIPVETKCFGTTVWNGTICASPAGGSVTLTATPTTIVPGDSSMLGWTSPFGSVCTGTNFSTGAGNPNEGNVSVSPIVTTLYTVTCDGTLASETVKVRKKPIFIED